MESDSIEERLRSAGEEQVRTHMGRDCSHQTNVVRSGSCTTACVSPVISRAGESKGGSPAVGGRDERPAEEGGSLGGEVLQWRIRAEGVAVCPPAANSGEGNHPADSPAGALDRIGGGGGGGGVRHCAV